MWATLVTVILVVAAAPQLAHSQQHLSEGDECYNQAAGGRGVCRRLELCAWAQAEISSGGRPQICGWITGVRPLMCCPVQGGQQVNRPTGWPGNNNNNGWNNNNNNGWTSESPPNRPSRPTSRPPSRPTSRPPNRPSSGFNNNNRPNNNRPTNNNRPNNNNNNRPAVSGRIAKKMCTEYAEFVFQEEASFALSPLSAGEKINQCAVPGEPLIVGGDSVNPKEFPHMALIGYGEKDDIAWQCGGSLIAPDFVLTAAHCLVTGDGQTARWVLLGELDISTTEDDAKPQTLEVGEPIRHPNYKPPQQYNDIALLRLKRAASMNGYVRPACLYTERSIAHPKDPMATGWGRTEWGGDPSDVMMKVVLPVHPYRVCNESYRRDVGTRQLPRGLLDDTQLCAGDLKGGKDTCQGDSGGPLQIFTSEKPYYCMHHIIGVTSFGKGCGFKNTPAIYTRVSSFVPWIESVVWPNQ